MTQNSYSITKEVDNLFNRNYTNFINQKDLKLLKGQLHKNEYQIYTLYPECNKVILYKKSIPEITMLEINTLGEIRHQDILGTLFSLGIKEELYGDIIKIDNLYYLFTFPDLKEFYEYNLTEINHQKITLKEVPLSFVTNFNQEYITREIIVSSLRIDNIIATLINTSRGGVLEKFHNHEVLLNYEEPKINKELQENDIFSIRKYGKFKFNKILKRTKKNGYIIEILQYK